MIFVKDDLILPHYYTFYDLAMNKIVSKQGNVLQFETINQSQDEFQKNKKKPVPGRWMWQSNIDAVMFVPDAVDETKAFTQDKLDKLHEQGKTIDDIAGGKTYMQEKIMEATAGKSQNEKRAYTELYFTHQGAVKMDDRDDDSMGRVILRAWYEKNKHIYPASRWEAFDPVTMVKVDNLVTVKSQTQQQMEDKEEYYKRML